MNEHAPCCVVIEDDRDMRTGLCAKLREEGFATREYRNGDEFEASAPDDFMAVFVDLHLGGTISGYEVLKRIGRRWGQKLVVIVSAYIPTDEDAVALLDALRDRKVQLVSKKENDWYERAAEMASEHWRELQAAQEEGGAVYDEGTQKIEALVPTLAEDESPVLLLGPTGAGKEFFAERIHRAKHKSNAPFRAVNCASWSDELLQSELFGHVSGAYTGAHGFTLGLFLEASGVKYPGKPEAGGHDYVQWLKRDKNNVVVPVKLDAKGCYLRMGRRYSHVPSGQAEFYLVLAKGETFDGDTGAAVAGTLLLDEIGDLTGPAQAALLRVLDGRGMMPVGYNGPPFLPNVRIMAATNRLRSMRDIGPGAVFREDLYWRLAGWVVKVPPVRSADAVQDRAAQLAAGNGLRVDEDALVELTRANEWRGNWREIDQVVRRAIAFAKAAKALEVCQEDVKKARAFALEEETPVHGGSVVLKNMVTALAAGKKYEEAADGRLSKYLNDWLSPIEVRAFVGWLHRLEGTWKQKADLLGQTNEGSLKVLASRLDVTGGSDAAKREVDELINTMIKPIVGSP